MLPSIPGVEAVDHLSVNLARAHAACTIVVLLRHTRIRVVQQGTGEMGDVPTVRGRSRRCSGAEQVG